MLIAVLGASGGAGATTVAIALARAAAGDAVLLDLDLGGGAVARRLGVEHDPLDPGLAGPEPAGAVLARAARPWAGGLVVPGATRPDLAWAVEDGAVDAACAAAGRLGRAVVADAGRGAGPALEAVVAADRVVVVVHASVDGIAAGSTLLATLDVLGVAGPRVAVCLNAVRPRQGRLASALAARLLRRPVDASVPRARRGDPSARPATLRALARLGTASTTAAAG